MTSAIPDAEDLEPHRRKSYGIQFFSTPSDASRVRWRSDLISAGFLAVLLLVLIAIAGEGSTVDSNTLEYIGTLPGWLLWLSQATYVVAVLYALALLLGVGIFARDRLELLRDLVLAAGMSVVIAVLLSQWVDDRWPQLALLDLTVTRETFPAFAVTMAVAIQAAASPHLSAPMRRIGWWFVLTAGVTSVLGGVTTVSDALGGVLVGLLAATIIRYAFGTSAGVPSINRIRAGLADLNLQVNDLAYSDLGPTSSITLEATSAEGDPLIIGVLGRDAWSSRRLTQWWRKAWYQDEGAQYGSDRRQQVEHQALALMLAQQEGVSVPGVVRVGMTAVDDALLVAERPDHTLSDVPAEDVDDELLDAIWSQLRALHRAGLSHGSLDAGLIWLDADEAPSLSGFADAIIQAGSAPKYADVAALLVTTTLIVGEDRAIAAARRAQGDAELAAMLPLLQTAALSPPLRREAKDRKLKISDLRKQTAGLIGTEVPHAEQLTRVSWKSILMVVFVGFAATTIVGGLAEVGLDTIVDALADARWGLVLIAVLLVQATNYTDAVSTVAVSPKPIPVGITTVEQFAIGFVNMAVPSAAGRMATNARYFQKFGIDVVTSTTMGVITSLIGFVAQMFLVVVAILAGQGSIDFSELETGGGVLRLLGMAVVIFVVVLVAVAAVPAWRRWAVAQIRTPLSQIAGAFRTVRDPKTAVTAFGGALATEVLYAAGLTMCVLAVGGSVSLGEVIFINVAVSLFAGLMPIPGGVGVTEAGLTAGLTSVGVESEIAVAAVVIYRLMSYYLPPIWGWFCLRWLTNHDYL